MTTYKNFHGTKEEYINNLIENIKHWAKVFANNPAHRVEWCWKLDELEQALAAEGWEWDEIEALEIAAY